MSLRKGMWHGLPNNVIIRNVKYGKWRKEINWTEKHVRVFAAPFLAPIWVSNVFAGPFITAGLNQQGRAETSDKLYCIRVYVILNLFLLLSTIVSLFLPTNVTKLFFFETGQLPLLFFSVWIKGREVEVANDRNNRKNERRKLRGKYIHGLIGFHLTQSYQHRRIKLWQTVIIRNFEKSCCIYWIQQ